MPMSSDESNKASQWQGTYEKLLKCDVCDGGMEVDHEIVSVSSAYIAQSDEPLPKPHAPRTKTFRLLAVTWGNEYSCPKQKAMRFEVRLRNTGVWPIDHVRLLIQKTMTTINLNTSKHKPGDRVQFSFKKENISLWPPLDALIAENHSQIIIRLKEALPPSSDVMVAGLVFKNISP
jgi:hypothetical protein